MELRVPAHRGAPLDFGAASYVVLAYHDDGTATIRTEDPAARPDFDGLLERLRRAKEPRARRAVQRQVEQWIDRLEGPERDQAVAAYRGV